MSENKELSRINSNNKCLNWIYLLIVISILSAVVFNLLHSNPTAKECQDKGMVSRKIGLTDGTLVDWQFMCMDKEGNLFHLDQK